MSDEHDHPRVTGTGAASRSRSASPRSSWAPRSSAPFLTGSLALLTDAAHMLTDAGGLLIAPDRDVPGQPAYPARDAPGASSALK